MEFQKADFDGEIPEHLADGFSYLLFLFNQRIGAGLVGTGPLNLNKAVTDHYLGMMKDAATLRTYMELEILIDFFGYACGHDPFSDIVIISPPSERFQKSLRFGFMQHSMQRIAAHNYVEKGEPPSLKKLGEALHTLMVKKELIKLVNEPVPRWRFEFPDLTPLRDLLKNPGYFGEEASWLTAVAKDLFVDAKQLENFEIAGQKTRSGLINVSRE